MTCHDMYRYEKNPAPSLCHFRWQANPTPKDSLRHRHMSFHSLVHQLRRSLSDRESVHLQRCRIVPDSYSCCHSKPRWFSGRDITFWDISYLLAFSFYAVQCSSPNVLRKKSNKRAEFLCISMYHVDLDTRRENMKKNTGKDEKMKEKVNKNTKFGRKTILSVYNEAEFWKLDELVMEVD